MTCTWSSETKICAERLIESETKTCAEIQIEGEIKVKVYLRLGKRSSYCDWCEVACVGVDITTELFDLCGLLAQLPRFC